MFSLRKPFYLLFLTGIIILPSALIFFNIDLLQLSYSQPNQQNNTDTVVIDNISDNPKDSTYPQTESSGKKVYVVWQDNMFGNSRLNYDILLKSSSDGGQTFGDIVNLSNNTGFSEHPQMAVNGSNIYIVWADNTALNRDIYLISSSDGGQTFGDIVNLSNNTADSYNQEISVSGDHVYITWLDSQKYIQGNNSISFIASRDGGQIFDNEVSLSNNAGKSSFPKISSFEDNVYVTWNIDRDDKSINKNKTNNNDNISANGNSSGSAKDGIYFVKSTDNGNNFDKEIRLSSNEKPGEVQMASNDVNVYIIWGAPDPSAATAEYRDSLVTNNENNGIRNVTTDGDGIYFVKSTDNGISFTKPSFIKDKYQNPLNVEIIEHAGELIIAIQATPINNVIEGNQDIFLQRSQDNGNSFSNAINVSNNTGISECPSMTVSSNNDLYLVWQDKSLGNNEAMATKIKL